MTGGPKFNRKKKSHIHSVLTQRIGQAKRGKWLDPELEQFYDVYDSLDDDQRDEIDMIMIELMEKGRRLGEYGALELVGKLGRYLVKNNICAQ